ncbi:unnamed protein product [Strongylus vulgaris]|uniref:Uncharacterized protein n=1 Tax=Strongylus vulgaris TaxID=40348 RepID=A0A3P7LPQ6_STRVU|nr:unnamed protein product [Strongylus vulgaris]
MAAFEVMKRRLREESEKASIIEKSSARPTEAQMQQKNKDWRQMPRLRGADYVSWADYIALKEHQWEPTDTVGESLLYILKLKEIRAKHLDELRELGY